MLATVGAARAAAAPDRVAWGARRRAPPALEAEAVPLQDAPRAADDGAWWAAAKSGESAAELERMSSLLRRHGLGLISGPASVPFEAAGGDVNAAPTQKPTPAPRVVARPRRRGRAPRRRAPRPPSPARRLSSCSAWRRPSGTAASEPVSYTHLTLPTKA